MESVYPSQPLRTSTTAVPAQKMTNGPSQMAFKSVDGGAQMLLCLRMDFIYNDL